MLFEILPYLPPSHAAAATTKLWLPPLLESLSRVWRAGAPLLNPLLYKYVGTTVTAEKSVVVVRNWGFIRFAIAHPYPGTPKSLPSTQGKSRFEEGVTRRNLLSTEGVKRARCTRKGGVKAHDASVQLISLVLLPQLES